MHHLAPRFAADVVLYVGHEVPINADGSSVSIFPDTGHGHISRPPRPMCCPCFGRALTPPSVSQCQNDWWPTPGDGSRNGFASARGHSQRPGLKSYQASIRVRPKPAAHPVSVRPSCMACLFSGSMFAIWAMPARTVVDSTPPTGIDLRQFSPGRARSICSMGTLDCLARRLAACLAMV